MWRILLRMLSVFSARPMVRGLLSKKKPAKKLFCLLRGQWPKFGSPRYAIGRRKQPGTGFSAAPRVRYPFPLWRNIRTERPPNHSPRRGCWAGQKGGCTFGKGERTNRALDQLAPSLDSHVRSVPWCYDGVGVMLLVPLGSISVSRIAERAGQEQRAFRCSFQLLSVFLWWSLLLFCCCCCCGRL